MVNSVKTQTTQGLYQSSSLYGTLGNSLSIALDSLGQESSSSHIKKYQVFEIEEDLLALSTTWYRLRQGYKQGEPYAGINKLTDKILFDRVTSKDRELASNIRDYYSKKIMMRKLKGQPLTRFREDMNTFIHSDGKVFKEEMCPLVYRIPEFYTHDTEFEKITIGCDKKIDIQKPEVSVHVLKHLGKIQIDKKLRKYIEYWFVDENNKLVNVTLDPNNPLLKIFDKIIQNPVTLSGIYFRKQRDDVDYFSIQKYEIV